MREVRPCRTLPARPATHVFHSNAEATPLGAPHDRLSFSRSVIQSLILDFRTQRTRLSPTLKSPMNLQTIFSILVANGSCSIQRRWWYATRLAEARREIAHPFPDSPGKN